MIAQGRTIYGKVYNTETKTPVPGAAVRIEHSNLGAFSDKDGKFRISSITQNQFKIIVSAVGYETHNQRLIFNDKDADSLEIIFKLNEASFKTSEIVVSANKKIEALQDIPISLSIIDSKQLTQQNSTLIEDALKYVPGVVVNQQSISIRGTSGFAFGLGSRVAMMIDGFPALSGDNGDIKYDIYPINQIDRIEVVKGAGSALYGTAAIGGVVNIITKDPNSKPELAFRIYTGVYTLPKYEQWQYRKSLPFRSGIDLNYSQSIDKLSYLVSGQLIRDESYLKYNDYTKWNILSKIKYQLTDFTSLVVFGNYASDNTTDWVYWNSLDSATIPPTKANVNIRIYSSKLFGATELKHVFSSDLFSSLKFSYLNTDFRNTFDIWETDYRQSLANSYNLELITNQFWSSQLNFTYGLNYNHNDVSSITYGNHNQNIYSAYIQGESTQIDWLILTAGGRLDFEQTEENNSNLIISPKLGLNLSLSDDTHIRLSAGRGFRAPTIAEKFASVNFQGLKVIPNLLLKPEMSWSAELGFNQQYAESFITAEVDAALFLNYMINLIEPTFDTSIPNAPIKFMNITEARIAGAEANLNFSFWKVINFKTALTLMDPIDITLNETLKYRNNIIWYSSLGFGFSTFEIQSDYRFMSKVKNVDEFLSLQIKDYDSRVPIHIIDARIILKGENLIGMPIRISLNAKNLLNYIYTEIPGNLGPTRHLSLQIEGRF
jgi:iron complex outermembrane receptor protein